MAHDVCVFGCADGYELSGNAASTCIADDGQSTASYQGHSVICTAITCRMPDTETRTTKHGTTWSRNDGYDIVETSAARLSWQVTAKCASGFAGTAVVKQCSGGPEYSISGCNLDTDGDGVSDDDEDCYDNPEKTGSAYLCGCNLADYDTGYANCPTQQQIGMGASVFYTVDTVQWDAKPRPEDGQNGVVPEFTAPAGVYSSVRLDPLFWTQEGTYLATDASQVWSSAEGTGKLTSHSFVISSSSLAFQAGYGGGGASIKLMTPAEDGTMSVRLQFNLIQHEIREVLWDMSGLLNEAAVIVIEKGGVDRMYVNNIRMFDTEPGCLSSCLTIEPAGDAALNLLSIMGTTYGPAYQGTSFKDDHGTIYCSLNDDGSISSGGGPFAQSFPVGFEYHKLGMGRLPTCMMIYKLADENTYHISVGEGTRRFSFSDSSGGDSNSLFCVYSTQQPSCIGYSNLLGNMAHADMHCSEVLPMYSCTETALSTQCPMAADAPCGDRKTQRDVLACCARGENIASCIGHTRRRLGASIRFSEDHVLDPDVARSCARACQQSNGSEKKCFAWRVDGSNMECKLSLKCYPESYPEVTSHGLSKKRWNLLDKGLNPFEGLTVTVRKQITVA